MIEQFPALIVVTPLIMSFILFAVSWWNKRLCFPILILTLSACIVFAIGILDTVIKQGKPIHYYLGGWDPPWGIEYVIDHLNALVLVAVAVVAWLVAIYSKSAVEKELHESKLPQFYTLFLLQVTGLFGITATGDMFNLYVLLEIASFSAYAIIAMGERGADFAAFRYVIFGTIGACAYLLGVGYLYILTGSLNMADLSHLIPKLFYNKALLVGFAFFLVGVGIKMGIFPVHFWLPDAYTLAPSAVSALLAPLFTKVGAYVIIRIMFTVFDPSFSIKLYPVMDILGWIAAVGIIFACIMALAQSDLKRMFCYLIVAEMGYIVIGIASGNRLGLTGAILHIINDMFMMACLFTVAGAIMYQMGTRNIYEFRYLHRTMPITLAVFVVGALSVVGVPPACGFFSKWYLILGTIQAKKWLLLFVLLASSLINAVLFFRVIENAYLEPREAHAHAHNGGHPIVTLDRVPLNMLIAMILIAAGIILLGLFSGKIVMNIIDFAIPANL
ncbi:MAG: monovalent cation/H+ antiporter subunit D family protein [Candidatus Desulfofervidus auxilii]|nr:monovalent cation/H+ antiporter subunit D family protein [Candidatus Desulfofervidus auxilii]